ncbi:MAG: M15 family metallopeptidase [Rhodothermales bacterium]|nr:M15 family metallopeptidase [Rhodothermales bacterium]
MQLRVAGCVAVILTAALSGPAFSQSSPREIVDVREIMPDLAIDSRYGTPDNFLDQKLYSADSSRSYLLLGAVLALRDVRAGLKGLGYDMKIWDGYRPRSVQYLMWEILPDPRFVADPASGSNHNRGSAVDVTLIDPVTREELDMGTYFDDFTDAAGHGYADLPFEVLVRRAHLRSTMDSYEFSSLFTEWWHYSYNLALGYPLKDYQTK